MIKVSRSSGQFAGDRPLNCTPIAKWFHQAGEYYRSDGSGSSNRKTVEKNMMEERPID